jgi:lipopolysaccharide export system permease protein
MKILRNHILLEFFTPMGFCLLSLLFVFLMGRGFVQMADLVFNKNVDIFLILKLLFFSFPFLLTFVIPMSVLVASLLCFGKLSFDNEIMAIRASGVSLLKIIQPLVIVTGILCLFSFVLSDQIASTSHYVYRQILTQIGIESPSAALEEGTFIKKFKNFVIFVYEIDKNKLKGVRIYQPQEGKPTRTIIAQKGELISIPEKNIIKLKLVHGISDEPDPKDPSKLYKLNFKTYDLPLNISGVKEPEALGKKPKDMTVKELQDEIKRLGQAGIKATYPLSAEIHNKIAISFSSLAFLLIGIPLGITTRRSEKSISFGISLALMTLYWILLIGGKTLAQKGLAPPFLALQFSNFVIGGLGLFLSARLIKS